MYSFGKRRFRLDSRTDRRKTQSGLSEPLTVSIPLDSLPLKVLSVKITFTNSVLFKVSIPLEVLSQCHVHILADIPKFMDLTGSFPQGFYINIYVYACSHSYSC